MIKNKIAYLYSILVNLYLLLCMGQSFEVQLQSLTLRKYIMFFIFVTFLINILRKHKEKITWIKPFIIYTFVCVFEILYHGSTNFIYELYFSIIILSSYYIYKDVSNNALNRILLIYLYFGVALFILFVYSNIGLSRVQGIYKSTCYYTCCMFPFYLLSKNNLIKYLGIAICFIPSILVAKRGPLIGITAAVVSYYVLSMKNSKNSVKIIVSAVVAVLIIYFALSNFDSDILERFSNMKEDQGSGRLDIFSIVLNEIIDNSFLEHLLGHGVYKEFVIEGDLSSHNDFIEMYWNYGLLGFISFIFILVRLFKYDKLYSLHRQTTRPVYFASLIQYIIMSLFTNMIFTPTYIAFFALFWSYYHSIAVRGDVLTLNKG